MRLVISDLRFCSAARDAGSLGLLEPTSSGGTWNAVTHCQIEITGGLNQFSEAMVGLLLLTVFV